MAEATSGGGIGGWLSRRFNMTNAGLAAFAVAVFTGHIEIPVSAAEITQAGAVVATGVGGNTVNVGFDAASALSVGTSFIETLAGWAGDAAGHLANGANWLENALN